MFVPVHVFPGESSFKNIYSPFIFFPNDLDLVMFLFFSGSTCLLQSHLPSVTNGANERMWERQTEKRGDVTLCLLISISARLTSPEQIRMPAVTQVEVMARKHPCLIAACPNTKMWADKDTYMVWKQRAAVMPLIDNSLTEWRGVSQGRQQPKCD